MERKYMVETVEKIVHGFLKIALAFILLILLISKPLMGVIATFAAFVIYYQVKHSTNKYNFYAKESKRSATQSINSSSQSEYEIVINSSKSLESELSKLGAQGKGLHEKATSIEHMLSPELMTLLRKTATIRNKLIHEQDYSLSDRELIHFKSAVQEALNLLDVIKPAPLYVMEEYYCDVCEDKVTALITSKLDVPLYASCEVCDNRLKDFQGS